MLEQFLNSLMVKFIEIEPMSAYVQSIPKDVEYPCALVNKVDVNQSRLNAYYFVNNVTVYVRVFGKNELELKNKALNITNTIFRQQGKIPILNEDGTQSKSFIRIEDTEMIPINVDENEIYCVEVSFNFDTNYIIDLQEFELLGELYLNQEVSDGSQETGGDN